MRIAFAALLLFPPVIASAQLVKVFNPSFERSVAPQDTGIVVAPSDVDQGALPSDSYWGFRPSTGVVSKDHIFDPGGFQVPPPPDGNQWAFLDPGSSIMWQTLMFPLSGRYTLTFANGLSDFIGVVIDNPTNGVALTRRDNNSDGVVSFSGSFDVNAGPHVLIFANTDAREDARPHPPALIDAVSVGPRPGDANLDGRVDFKDLLIVAQHYGLKSGQAYDSGDFNQDGAVGFDDLLVLSQNYGGGEGAGAAAAVPEPSLLLLVVLPFLTRARRRGSRA